MSSPLHPSVASPAAPDAAAVAARRRAFGVAVGVVLVAGAIVWVSGVLSDSERLAGSAGVGLAVVVGAAVLWLQPRLLRHEALARSPGTQVQLALGLGFVGKLCGLALGVAVLLLAKVKFVDIAAFAVAFAAASLVFSVCNAALSARGISREAADPARPDPLR